MTTSTIDTGTKALVQDKPFQATWQRIILLFVLGYETIGCLLGGMLLMAAPDGRYMKMPVEMMHGFFPDFLIPGIILFGLGILNLLAFVSVLLRKPSDWLMVCLALGGLFIWFIAEIIIIRELHWLHAMWGLPVMLGWVVAIPLLAFRQHTVITHKFLMLCGVLSSIWYIAINIYVPVQYEGYSMASQAPSELSAIDAPTRILWVLLVMLYPLLFAAFGWGVWRSAAGNRRLYITGALIIIYCILNFYWPPMHRREVIAAGGGSITDTLHLIWASMTVIFMMLMMGFGAAALDKRFRIYTILNFILFIIFGGLTFKESTALEANLPTPLMGVWERINIAAFMIWVIVFAFMLIKRGRPQDVALVWDGERGVPL